MLKVVGWRTFRHSYSRLLRASHTDVKVQQEILRHSNIATTMNVYTQAVSKQKRRRVLTTCLHSSLIATIADRSTCGTGVGK